MIIDELLWSSELIFVHAREQSNLEIYVKMIDAQKRVAATINLCKS